MSPQRLDDAACTAAARLLSASLAERTTIGEAVGILQCTHGCDAGEAVRVLARGAGGNGAEAARVTAAADDAAESGADPDYWGWA
ncbi:ANTAR domain-containing protein [Amycolatopsis sp. NPDC004079]|uniref:ANTAR domain-containing protein n=1 Tax=Amycolatopsis sp. NPDC004079 TaxID=3154549 RepID=UPI00339F7EFF